MFNNNCAVLFYAIVSGSSSVETIVEDSLGEESDSEAGMYAPNRNKIFIGFKNLLP